MISLLFLSVALWGCDDGTVSHGDEIVVSRDCSTGSEKAGFKFDSDSIRCGNSGDIFFGLGWAGERYVSRIGLYWYSDSGAKNTKDSLWILETDSVKISTCEKLDYSHKGLAGVFCLHKFDDVVGRDSVDYSYNEKTKEWGTYFIYHKYGSYKAFCNALVDVCQLLYSCIVRYDESYLFSSIPNADNVNRIRINCID